MTSTFGCTDYSTFSAASTALDVLSLGQPVTTQERFSLKRPDYAAALRMVFVSAVDGFCVLGFWAILCDLRTLSKDFDVGLLMVG